ncbi:1-deoxy-D-xylulose-5-phosphate synthase N-terminal domain-containing protein [Phaeocystidibacter luteus]|uniref:1-deoxy-D-xylulose-5-phosphate synthase n=1 Tax=Phaeocystidibacter luteus TaxID=911197 RepID=A0A6N6RFU9_9FLAO|nr:1-deoxy-D-xylulose-5-phosphate synthase [Phaeocystidibacter luteus]KAB2808638.1 1-deoxy-D-xylulose-5-phosphate synthase [Phaeocystidibacter luteus]
MPNIPSLEELRRMSISELEQVAVILREFIPNATKEKKGHLESSLSVCELTVALHHVLKAPEDVLIWDVGHQAYVHKVLTDRADKFSTNRKHGGLSGFPSRSESPYDAFGTGHSSTSISAVTGMAIQDYKLGRSNQHVAVIGDGALTGGMAFEALNYLGTTGLDVLIILNDNQKAIDPNVGALHEGQTYEMFFQSMNIRYMGSVNGHQMSDLVQQLRYALSASGPRVLHVETIAEFLPSEPNYKSELPFQDVFGQAIEELLERDDRLTVVSPAMLSGAGLSQVAAKYPQRVLDVGIAEQNAATLSAGIAAAGGVPILHLYSTFAQRAYDQIIHDIALQNLHVIICLDRAGLVGNDGPTHHGAFDLAFLRPIPNLVISAPRNGIELRNVLYTATQHNGPFVIRYPRDTEARFDAQGKFDDVEFGSAEVLREGKKLYLMSTGTMSRRAMDVANTLEKDGYTVGVIHHTFIKPIDKRALSAASRATHWVALEDSSVGGLGSALSEWLHENRVDEVRLSQVHLPDRFVEHGSVDELHLGCGMDTESVVNRCRELLHS